MRLTRRKTSRDGWVLLDVVSGLLLMLVTLALLGTVLTRSKKTATRLSDDRAAVRLAERTLLVLNSHGNAPTDEHVRIEPLEVLPELDRHWVRITADVNGREASIVGFVSNPSPSTAPTTAPSTEVNP